MRSFAEIIDAPNRAKLEALHNSHVSEIVRFYTELCQPRKVTVITDSAEDIAYVRQLALDNGEESPLAIPGHTIHFDGYGDQARDKDHTCVLVPPSQSLGRHINTRDREAGLKEVLELMQNIMTGKEMLVRFFCLGPQQSAFAIPALQLTDSSYVAHSEDLLYRPGYEQFMRLQGRRDFFHFIHSAGELDERGCSKNIAQRRIYIDLEENRVFTINNQYAGNSLGLKKLALRLAINKANHEDWLAEHMFIMGVHPLHTSRTSYFMGAFPSACGKTSTAMIPGQTIVGDDIAYLKVWDDGACHAVNIEQGIFGIITDVNPTDDPLIYECLTTPRELIFSNVLIHDRKPYWLGMGCPTPSSGINHSGAWQEGNRDEKGQKIPLAHKNARYTIRLSELANLDPGAETKNGVMVDAIIYGGRDSDTNVPVVQSLDWKHGVLLGAALESETTAATLGKEGERKHSPMANLDFIVVPLARYIQNHLAFGRRLSHQPLIFGTNYFLKAANGQFLADKVDKKIWMLWAEGRVHHEFDAISTPVGYIPYFADLRQLFRQALGKDYPQSLYEEQFSIRTDQLLAKYDRIRTIFETEQMPEEFLAVLNDQCDRLAALRRQTGKAIISPGEL